MILKRLPSRTTYLRSSWDERKAVEGHGLRPTPAQEPPLYRACAHNRRCQIRKRQKILKVILLPTAHTIKRQFLHIRSPGLHLAVSQHRCHFDPHPCGEASIIARQDTRPCRCASFNKVSYLHHRMTTGLTHCQKNQRETRSSLCDRMSRSCHCCKGAPGQRSVRRPCKK